VADHIERLGYKNILLVTDHKKRNSDEPILHEVILTLTSKQGINKPEIAEIRAPVQSDELDFSSIEKYLRPPYSVQLMIILHADLVYAIMSALQLRKIRVPQDVAIISMEDGIGFDLLHSPVTRLKKPLSGLALKVANMIWSEVKNSGKGKYKRQVTLAPELIIRNSCGTL
jgi:DNA-binding LacI/PurR family transcriptional regulator